MVSLIDIVEQTSTVRIGEHDVTVHGISAENIAQVLLRFPEIRMILIAETGVDRSVVMSLVERFPEAAGLILAAATGADLAPGDEKKEAELKKHVDAARRLPIGAQYEILEKTVDLTFPRGVENFLAGVGARLKRLGVGRGWAAGTTSLEPSNSASSTAAASETA
jgi:hypothetical protein